MKDIGVSEKILIITNIALAIFTGVQVFENNKLIRITNLKYQQENRPYVSIESLNWIDKFPTLFSVGVKAQGSFPAKTTLQVLITDTEGHEILKQDISEFSLFPFYKSANVEINQGFSSTPKGDDSKTLVFSSKDSEKVKNLLNSGEIIGINISAKYSSFVQGGQFSNKYHYSRDFLLKKDGDSVLVEPTKIDAN